MALAESPGIALAGVVATVAVFAAIRWDAGRVDIDRPTLWAAIAAVPVLMGFSMYLFVSVPMTGIIVTANTGLVLYGFEREVTTGEEESLEPGSLPNRK